MAGESGIILSIITITYEDQRGLITTRDSLRELIASAGQEIEWLVQDGGSAYDLEHVVGMEPSAAIVSQRDGGLYDAMNRALARSSGQWVWMLNGGDECLETDWARLRKELQNVPNDILLYDFEQVFNGVTKYRRARAWSDMKHALPTSHQAMIFPGDAARRTGYSTAYLAGDYQHAARLMMSGIEGVRMGRFLARFHTGGRSTTDVRRVARDARAVQIEILDLSPGKVLVSQFRHAAARTRLKLRLKAGSGVD